MDKSKFNLSLNKTIEFYSKEVNNMKVVILAGGLGTRLSEYTHSIPKPMVKIGKVPIVVHIMSHYLRYGFSDFILATGYKSIVFKKYFKNFRKSSKSFNFKIKKKNCKVNIVDTGLSTLTGRLKKIGKYLDNNDLCSLMAMEFRV